ncbi:hypothetical protein DPEC_G00182880 [Dallia pectoralis]|uniref:Uncharacterized protein n=1 Tax=Dallia pectoralis TaxID=75939 RepID=A0ACC2GAX1_DALPE|nr:hypothetical protein DPEC_G00182880 [Dallia pectoralis]
MKTREKGMKASSLPLRPSKLQLPQENSVCLVGVPQGLVLGPAQLSLALEACSLPQELWHHRQPGSQSFRPHRAGLSPETPLLVGESARWSSARSVCFSLTPSPCSLICWSSDVDVSIGGVL